MLRLSEDIRLIRVTPGNIRQNHIYIHSHFDLFPEDCVGCSRGHEKGKSVEIYLEGVGETVATDVGRDRRTGKPRNFLRGRAWVGRFYRHHKIKAGDLIALERVAARRFVLRPASGALVIVPSLQEEKKPDGLKSIELFAGAGGLALGTARAGLKHELVLEWDSNACETLRLNKARGVEHVRDWIIAECDVSQYDFRQHQDKVELITGGPPCQPFSLGGKHKGHTDNRNMFPEAVRAVREIRPRAFIFENVKGLLRRGFANYYSYIIHQLQFPEVTPRGDEEWTDHLGRLHRIYTGSKWSGLRYNVVFQLLNSADYGIPQRRERVIIVGVRSDLGVEFEFPRRTHTEDALLADKWVNGDYWEKHRIPKRKRPEIPDRLRARVGRLSGELRELMGSRWLTVRDAISGLPRISVGQMSTKIDNHFLNPGARSYAGHTGSPLDEPAKALKAGDHGVPGGENTLRLEDGSVRYLSVRECARLQTFPDDWSLRGSWTEAMRQLGNAVPVRLGEVVSRNLVRLLRQPPRIEPA